MRRYRWVVDISIGVCCIAIAQQYIFTSDYILFILTSGIGILNILLGLYLKEEDMKGE